MIFFDMQRANTRNDVFLRIYRKEHEASTEQTKTNLCTVLHRIA
jgi:hypothetical protein